MKKKLVALMTAAVTVGTLAGCAAAPAPAAAPAAEAPAAEAATEAAAEEAAPAADDGELTTVGFAQVGHESDWRTASTNSVQAALSKENGIDLQFVDCDNDSAAQLEAVRNFIQQGVDYIVIDPIVSTGWDTVLTEADDAGIPVIVIDRTIDDSDKYTCWIGSEFTNEGLAAGAWLKDYAASKASTRSTLWLSPVQQVLLHSSAEQLVSTSMLSPKAGTRSTSSPVTSLRTAARRLWSLT